MRPQIGKPFLDGWRDANVSWRVIDHNCDGLFSGYWLFLIVSMNAAHVPSKELDEPKCMKLVEEDPGLQSILDWPVSSPPPKS